MPGAKSSGHFAGMPRRAFRYEHSHMVSRILIVLGICLPVCWGELPAGMPRRAIRYGRRLPQKVNFP